MNSNMHRWGRFRIFIFWRYVSRKQLLFTCHILLFLLFIPSFACSGEMNKWYDSSPDLNYLQKLPKKTLVLYVSDSSPYKTFRDLLSAAKEKHGTLQIAGDNEHESIVRKIFESEKTAVDFIPCEADAMIIVIATILGKFEAGVTARVNLFDERSGQLRGIRILAVLD